MTFNLESFQNFNSQPIFSSYYNFTIQLLTIVYVELPYKGSKKLITLSWQRAKPYEDGQPTALLFYEEESILYALRPEGTLSSLM